MEFETLYTDATGLLKRLIAIPSVSGSEGGTADCVAGFLTDRDIPVHRHKNNVWTYNLHFDPSLPTILLNSHHDTVKPNPGYTLDPFSPVETSGRLYGLGSNDAGASVVSLIAAFLHLYGKENLRYNLCLAITAEEEISGRNGIESILPCVGAIDFALVGEPTRMQMAVAERGLVVLDCVAKGKAGHAARNEGENAIYKAVEDIEWFRNYRFPRKSEMFGEMSMNVTMINAGSQHNVIPAECAFTVDVRVTDRYTNEEAVEIIRNHVQSAVIPRSTRLKPSFIPLDHPIVKSGKSLGLNCFGSPTTSDQALLPMVSLKIGPGDSARSHMADEYVYLAEIREGIEIYINLLSAIL